MSNPDDNNDKKKTSKLACLLFVLAAAAACVPFLYFLIQDEKNSAQLEMAAEVSDLDEFLQSEECASFFENMYHRLEAQILDHHGGDDDDAIVEYSCSEQMRTDIHNFEKKVEAAISSLGETGVDTLTCPVAYAMKIAELAPYSQKNTASYDACKAEVEKELTALHETRRALAEPRRIGQKRNLSFWGGCDFFDDDDWVGTSGTINGVNYYIVDTYLFISCDLDFIGTNCALDDDEFDWLNSINV